MDDPITRARKEWCESPEPANYPASRLQRYTAPCPPEVVAALLDVLDRAIQHDHCPFCRPDGDGPFEHNQWCSVPKAEAAITRALEKKP